MKPKQNAPQYKPQMSTGPTVEKKQEKRVPMESYPSTLDMLRGANFDRTENTLGPPAPGSWVRPHVCIRGSAIRVYNTDYADDPESYFDPMTSPDTPRRFIDWLCENTSDPLRSRAEDLQWIYCVAAAFQTPVKELYSGPMEGIFGKIMSNTGHEIILQRRGLGGANSPSEVFLFSTHIRYRKVVERIEAPISYSGHSGLRCEHAPPNYVLQEVVRRAISKIEHPQPAVIEQVQQVAPTPPEEIKDMSTPPKIESPTRLQQITEIAKTDATDAAWRTAASQFVKLTRDPLVGLLSRHLGPDDEALRGRIATFLSTEVGTAIVAGILSIALGALPQTAGPAPDRLARELRVRAMADVSDSVADLLMGPLRQVIMLYLQDPGFAAIQTKPAEPGALPQPAGVMPAWAAEVIPGMPAERKE